MDNGKVILAGAGPGDPELLTLKAKKAIQSADVILMDYLAHPNSLHFAKPDVAIINVGKKKGQHEKTQDQINRLMKQYADDGKLVLRLKGGDPCIFGRLGEEMEYLHAHDIPFEVIPGVSSASAVPIYAGIPLTHRRLSKSVAFVTGSPKKGECIHDIHFPDAETLVFLMPITQLDIIIKRLISMASFNKQTPAALIHRGTYSAQKTLTAPLGDIYKKHQETGISSPAIFIVGDVVSCHDHLHWRDTLPLFGRRVFLLRTINQGSDMAETLASLGAEVIQLPMIRIVPNVEIQTDITPRFLDAFDTIIFTSPNGVIQCLNALMHHGGDSRCFAGKRIVSIGPATTSALKAYGLMADITATTYRSEGIIDHLQGHIQEATILIPTAQGARDILPTSLRQEGANVTVKALYQTMSVSIPSGTSLRDNDIIAFTSSSIARHFFESGLLTNQTIVPVCIGELTADTVRRYTDIPPIISSDASTHAMIEAIKRLGTNDT